MSQSSAELAFDSIALRRQRSRYLEGMLCAKGLIGIALVVSVLVLGVLAPLLVPVSPSAQSAPALEGPSAAHPLGTDELGRDLFSRVLHGARVDLLVSVLAVPLSAIAGTLLGLIGGLSRWAGTGLQRLFDVILGFPAMILGIALAAVLGPGQRAVVITIFLANLPIFGRLARGALLSHREREYAIAAQVVGASPRRILLRHILPNSVDALIVQLALAMSYAVFIEGGLSVIGLGIQPPKPSLGTLLNGGLPYLSGNPSYVLGPIAVLMALVVGFNLIADALNDALLRR